MKRHLLLSMVSVLFVFSFCASSCDNSSGVKGEVEYQPPLLPVKLVVDTHGNVSIQGNMEIVTWIGTLSINADVPFRVKKDNLIVIIKDMNQGDEGIISVYEIESGEDEFVAVVNGRTEIGITKRQVVIDISDGTVESIEFHKAPKSDSLSIIEDDFWKPYPFGYKPFMLASWAYDDSTMEKWCGLGFLWFLVRLVVAICLFIVDLFITINMIPALILYSLYGETARNVCCGITSLYWCGNIVAFLKLANE